MSVLRIRYSIVAICVMTAILGAQAQCCFYLNASPWPSLPFGAAMGSALAIAPAVIYQRYMAGLVSALAGGLAGAFFGRIAEIFSLTGTNVQLSFLLGWLLFGVLIGGLAGASPTGIHLQRAGRGALGGAFGGVVAGGTLLSFPASGPLFLVASAVAGAAFGAAHGFAVWSAPHWIICLDADREMASAFPVYDHGPTLVGALFHPTRYCLPHDNSIGEVALKITPRKERGESRRYFYYRVGPPTGGVLSGGTSAGGELHEGSEIVLGRTRLIFSQTPIRPTAVGANVGAHT